MLTLVLTAGYLACGVIGLVLLARSIAQETNLDPGLVLAVEVNVCILLLILAAKVIFFPDKITVKPGN
jgi:hypothetical protein